MTDHLDEPIDEPVDDPASNHLRAELREPRHTGLGLVWHRVLYTVGVASGFGGPSMADLVVVRRDTGASVIRTKAGQLDEADHLLQTIATDLDRMTTEQFLAEWGHLKP
ncbi:hypothetical protein [Agromyces silvae]|uniref:hypothetical protein n=1 Tax=Agromyces silvae TaxID=3388266 RepID=UPI00280B3194|nr:hypothetical protein [Agromyces protaetiae]